MTPLSAPLPPHDTPPETLEACLASLAELRARHLAMEGLVSRVSANLTDAMFYQVVVSAERGRQFTYVSEAVEHLHGYTREAVLADASLLYQSIHPDDAPMLAALEKHALETMSDFHATVRIVKPDGTLRWARLKSSPRRVDDAICWDGIEIDVTEQHRVIEELEKSRRQLNEAQHLAQIGAWELDLRTRELAWSDEVFRIFETDPGRVTPSYESFLGMIHPDDRDAVNTAYLESVKNKTRYEIVHRLRFPEGRVKFVRERGVTTYAADGTPLSSLGTVQDITAAHLAEQEQSRLREQLERSHRLESVGRLAAGVAHDFNNMLGIILGYSDLIDSQLAEDDPLRHEASEIHRAALRAAEVTRQLLAFSRQQPLHPKVHDLNTLVVDLRKMLGRLLGENITLTLELDPRPATATVDAGQIDRILVNLAANARDAMTGHGEFTLGTRRVTLAEAKRLRDAELPPGDYIRLTARDTGCGMSAEVREWIFEPFFTTKESGRGTGLGLATVYGIVRQSGGAIEVESEPGAGTTFCLYFPAAEIGTPRPATPPPAAPAPTGDGRHILLVEDEPALLDLVAAMLTRRGHRVTRAENATQALELVEARGLDYDFLLSDMMMPGMNGPQLAARLRERKPGLKVLFMSGYTDHEVIRDALLDADTGFIQKPMSSAQLVQKIAEMCSPR